MGIPVSVIAVPIRIDHHPKYRFLGRIVIGTKPRVIAGQRHFGKRILFEIGNENMVFVKETAVDIKPRIIYWVRIGMASEEIPFFVAVVKISAGRRLGINALSVAQGSRAVESLLLIFLEFDVDDTRISGGIVF